MPHRQQCVVVAGVAENVVLHIPRLSRFHHHQERPKVCKSQVSKEELSAVGTYPAIPIL